jgi:hypothetical protein
MGQSVVLKILLSRPSFDYDDPKSARTLKITAGGDTFSGLSKSQVLSESRYNEDRTVLVCKRVFDSALSIVSIEEPGDAEVRSPRITLLTQVKVPAWIVVVLVAGVVLSAALVAFDADTLKFIATWLPDPWGKRVDGNAKALAGIGKTISPLPIGISAFLAFKRLPIK